MIAILAPLADALFGKVLDWSFDAAMSLRDSSTTKRALESAIGAALTSSVRACKAGHADASFTPAADDTEMAEILAMLEMVYRSDPDLTSISRPPIETFLRNDILLYWRDVISEILAPLDDPSLTDSGRSWASDVGIDVECVTDNFPRQLSAELRRIQSGLSLDALLTELRHQSLLNLSVVKRLSDNSLAEPATTIPVTPAVGRALRRYLYAEAKQARTVRFQELSIERELFKVFVDAPLTIEREPSSDWPYLVDGGPVRPSSAFIQPDVPWFAPDGIATHSFLDVARMTMPGSQWFLERPLSTPHDRVTLEAPPGYGKSTLMQYVCQVHRVLYLEREAGGRTDITPITIEALSGQPVRIPIRINGKLFGSWLASVVEDIPPSSDMPSEVSSEHAVGDARHLWNYLTEEISRRGSPYVCRPEDLVDLLAGNDLLIVLDGLDEIRNDAIRAVARASFLDFADQVELESSSTQVVITQRPPPFASSEPSQPTLPTVRLRQLTQTLIRQFVRTWIVNRPAQDAPLEEEEASFLAELDDPEVGHLATNPMQLTILLGIKELSGALPRDRTDLYREYVKVYFNREATKAEEVRRHRKKLEAIHEFIAWTLIARADRGLPLGVGRSELESLFRTFLRGAEKDANELLKGVDRVFLLVSSSRDEPYDFDVEPLKEYFCARHIYEAASAGQEDIAEQARAGIDSRFACIAYRPTWLNTVRFYVGGYRLGELPSVRYRVRDALDEPVLALNRGVRSVAMQLIADGTFDDDRLTVARAELLEDLLNGHGVRMLYHGDVTLRSALLREADRGLPIPVLNGLLSSIVGPASLDYAITVLNVLNSATTNSDSRSHVLRWWRDFDVDRLHCNVPDAEATILAAIGLFGELRVEERRQLVEDAKCGDYVVRNLLVWNKSGADVMEAEWWAHAVNAAIEGRWHRAVGTAPEELSQLWAVGEAIDTLLTTDPASGEGLERLRWTVVPDRDVSQAEEGVIPADERERLAATLFTLGEITAAVREFSFDERPSTKERAIKTVGQLIDGLFESWGSRDAWWWLAMHVANRMGERVSEGPRDCGRAIGWVADALSNLSDAEWWRPYLEDERDAAQARVACFLLLSRASVPTVWQARSSVIRLLSQLDDFALSRLQRSLSAGNRLHRSVGNDSATEAVVVDGVEAVRFFETLSIAGFVLACDDAVEARLLEQAAAGDVESARLVLGLASRNSRSLPATPLSKTILHLVGHHGSARQFDQVREWFPLLEGWTDDDLVDVAGDGLALDNDSYEAVCEMLGSRWLQRQPPVSDSAISERWFAENPSAQ